MGRWGVGVVFVANRKRYGPLTFGNGESGGASFCGLLEFSRTWEAATSYDRLAAAVYAVFLGLLINLSLGALTNAAAQAKPSGSLLNVSAAASDEQMMCATYQSGSKRTSWLMHVDGRRVLGKNFWSMTMVLQQMQLLSRQLKWARPFAAAARLGKVNSLSVLKSFKQDLRQCAVLAVTKDAKSGVRFGHVQGILEKRCMECHASRGVTNTEEWYRANGYVIPGNPAASPLYTALKNNPEKFPPGNMPQNGGVLSNVQIMLLNRWVRDLSPTGAPGTPTPGLPGTPPPRPTATPLPGSPTPTAADEIEQGRNLYSANCAVCHGPLETSTKLRKTAQEISAAMGPTGIPQMQTLHLNSEAIRKIALALNVATPTPVPSPTSVPRFQIALNVLRQHCFGCHAGGAYNWGSYTTEQQWVEAQLVQPGDMRASRLTLRIKYGAQDNPIGSEDMPSPKHSVIWNNFTPQDYQIIRDWIVHIDRNRPPPDPHVVSTEGTIFRGSTDSIRLGDRLFIKNVLLDIFGPSASSVVDTLVATKLGIFGGPCDPRDIYQTYGGGGGSEIRAYNHINDCLNVDIEDTRASLLPPSSALRAGMVEKACLSLSFNATTLRYAAEGAGGTGATSRWPTTSDVEKVYQSFYPGRQTPIAVRDSLSTVVSGAQSRFPTSALEGWRYLFIATCNGGEWQQP